MTFYAIQIEPCPGFGWQGGAEFDTLIRPLENGRNRRRPRRYVALHRYVSPMNNIPVQAARSIKRVFMGVLGAAHTFLHLDYIDFEDEGDGILGTGFGDSIETVFQLKKTYSPGGGATHERDITKPDVAGEIVKDDDAGVPIVVLVDGVPTAATVSATTGLATFSVAPAGGAVLTWTGRFYICVRFNRDDLPFTIDNKSGTAFITNGSLELIEELNE